MCSVSRGNCVRIKASSASATFFAAANRLKRSIEPLMSSNSTVEHRDTASEPCTSKSCGASRRGGCSRGTQHRIHHGTRQVDIERFPKDIGFRLFQALAAGAALQRPMLAKLVTPQRRKNILHRLLGNLPDTPCRQFESLLALADVALLLELLGQVL